MENPIFPHTHYNYEELEDIGSPCMCVLCKGYRLALAVSVETAATTEGHKFRCRCGHCNKRKSAERALLVASNRRDTFSELTWIAHTFSWRDRFLSWAWARIADDKWQTSYYWSHEAERKTLGSWLEDWQDSDEGVTRLVSSERLLRGEPI